MITTVVVGNPDPQSRTLAEGVHLADLITDAAPDHVIDSAPSVPDCSAGATMPSPGPSRR